jgi:hypothetical protein
MDKHEQWGRSTSDLMMKYQRYEEKLIQGDECGCAYRRNCQGYACDAMLKGVPVQVGLCDSGMVKAHVKIEGCIGERAEMFRASEVRARLPMVNADSLQVIAVYRSSLAERKKSSAPAFREHDKLVHSPILPLTSTTRCSTRNTSLLLLTSMRAQPKRYF